MAIEETYPGYESQIRAARADGFSDEEIQSAFQRRIQSQSRAGQSVRQIQSGLGQEQPGFLERLASGPAGDLAQSGLEALAYPVEVAAGAIGGTLKPAARIGAAGLANLVAATTNSDPRALEQKALSLVDRASPYFEYQPQGKLARTTLEVAGAPFAGAEEALKAAGLPEEQAKPLVEVGGLVLPYLFHAMVGRAPRSPAEVEQFARQEPAAVEALKRLQETAPPDIAARIEAAKRDGFTEPEIAQQLIDRSRQAAPSAPVEKAPVSVEPTAKGPEFFSTLRDLGYTDEQLRTMPFAEKVRRARDQVPAETPRPIEEAAPRESITPEDITPEVNPPAETFAPARSAEIPIEERIRALEEENAQLRGEPQTQTPPAEPADLTPAVQSPETTTPPVEATALETSPVARSPETLSGIDRLPNEITDLAKTNGIDSAEVPALATAIEKLGTDKLTAPSAEPATSIKNAIVDQELAKMGLPPATHGERLSFEEARANAARTIESDPFAGQKLVDDLVGKPRPATATEDALLLHEQTRLKNERVQAEDQLIEAQKSGDQTAIAEAKAAVEKAKADFATIADVVTKTGTESALSLGHRRMMMKEDYSLAAMERAKQVANDGKPLTEAQSAEVKAAYEKIAAIEKAYEERIAKAEAGRAEAESKLAHTRLVIEAAKETKVEPHVQSIVDRVVAVMENEANAARQRLHAKLGRLSAGLDPTLISDMAIVGAAKIARGALEFGRWSKAMIEDLGQGIEPFLQAAWEASNKRLEEFVQKRVPERSKEPVRRAMKAAETIVEQRDAIKEQIRAKVEGGEQNDIGGLAQKLARGFLEQGIKERGALIDAVHGEIKGILPEMTRRETMDAISGYGKFKQLSKEEIAVQLRDLKGQMQQVAKLEDIEAKKPPLKTGVEQRAPSAEERQLIQQVNEAKRHFGIETTDPARQLKSALDAIKTRMRNNIADLEQEIVNRKLILKEKTATPYDAEAQGLKAELESLRGEFTKVFTKPELTDAQRVKLATAAVERSIADLNKRIESGDTGPQPQRSKTPATPELEALRARRDNLTKQLDRIRDSKTVLGSDPFVRQTRSRLEKSIADLERRITNGDLSTRTRPAPLSTPAIEDMRTRRNSLQEQLQELRDLASPKKTPEEIALSSLKARLTNRTAELQDRLARGDFSQRVRREVQLDEEAKHLQFEKDKAVRNWNEALMKDRLANRTTAQKIFGTRGGHSGVIGEALNTSRALLTSLDLSAVLRQGGFIGFGHPLRAARAFPDMFRALISEKGQHRVNQEIQSRPNYPLYKRSKLFLSEEAQTLSQMEEAYMSRWAQKIPGVGASERAYTTFLNKLRADSFDTMKNTLGRGGEVTAEEAKAIANYINVATGRGDPGLNASWLMGLNKVFFAPRNVASRFQLLAGQPFYRGTWRTRMLVAQEYGRFLTGAAMVYALGKLAGADVETDPRSADFGKLRFGNTRVDPMTGLLQVSVLLSRLGSGETKTLKGNIVPIRGEKVPFGTGNSADVIARFLRSKLAPVAGNTVDILTGKNVVGQPVTPGSVAQNVTMPLAFGDIYNAMVDQGVPRGAALSVLGIFGMGLQSFQPRQSKMQAAQ